MNRMNKLGSNTSLGPRLPGPVLRRAAAALALAAVVTLSGCASNNPRDPLEPMNRAIYSFNDGFDRAIAKPVAQGYRTVVPGPARDMVTSFFSNLDDFWVLVNNLLQGKPRDALDDLGRVTINSTVGLFGLLDFAGQAGLPKHNEDFGQTLGRWGVGPGPYVVIPFFGPSDVRDALAWGLVDTYGDPVWRIHDIPVRNSLVALRLVNNRTNLLDATNILQQAALDPYTFLRDAYLQRRRSLVYDGNPPPEPDAAPDKDDAAPATGKDKRSDAGAAAEVLGAAPQAVPLFLGADQTVFVLVAARDAQAPQ
jgi:phospholipid-binding lipoprotein MlaA